MIIHKKNFFNNFPTWEKIIKILDYQYNNPTMINESEGTVHKNNSPTGIRMMNRLCLHSWGLGNSQKILLDEFKNIYSIFLNHNKIEKNISAKMVLNFVGNESVYDIHKDIQYVISFQCIGNIEYRIFEDEINTDNYISYFLEPGDAFYISPGTVHQVVVNEPRVTVLFDFLVKDYELLPQDILNS